MSADISSINKMTAELGARLVRNQVMTRVQWEGAVERAQLLKQPVTRVLADENLASEEEVLKVLADLSRVPFVSLASTRIDRAAVEKMLPKTALHFTVIPIAFSGDGALTLATPHVRDAYEEQSLQLVLGMPVRWALCRHNDIVEAIKFYYGLGADVMAVDEPAAAVSTGLDVGATSEGDHPGIIKFVRQMIGDAIQMNATDIHFDPFETYSRLRYRVDGALQEIPLPANAHRFHRAVVSAIKVMSHLNIAERRLPQDGRLKITLGAETFDARVSVIPCAFGESVNLRLLNRQTTFMKLTDLGLREDQLDDLREIVSAVNGLVLITGPTGSGKTTTLYASLAQLDASEVNIVTIEDPVEYQMDRVMQIQVNPAIGLTFAAGLRSVLRHDPDVVLVGEIRDTETAEIAVRSALTGHLVLSTLHTNDAVSSVTRLIDMGIEPFLAGSTLRAVIAQRLVRRICASCREPAEAHELESREIRRVAPERAEKPELYRGRGCPECHFTGYRGRQAIIEIMKVNDEIRSLISRQAGGQELMRAALAAGLRPLRRSGWLCALDGITTVNEVLRVTQGMAEG